MRVCAGGLTDYGTEKHVVDSKTSLSELFNFGGGKYRDHLCPNALRLPGIKHILNDSLRRAVEHSARWYGQSGGSLEALGQLDSMCVLIVGSRGCVAEQFQEGFVRQSRPWEHVASLLSDGDESHDFGEWLAFLKACLVGAAGGPQNLAFGLQLP